MPLKIHPYTKDKVAAVCALNERIRKGGSDWGFYDSDVPDWLPPAPGASAWRDLYVLEDDESGLVRGGFIMKHEKFLFDGREQYLAHTQGPVAESVVDPSLKGLGYMMVKDALARQPLQTGWGATRRKGWPSEFRPVLIHIVRKARFLRGNGVLRKRRAVRLALDLAAMTGLGSLGLKALQGASAAQARLARRVRPARDYVATDETSFGPWADEVWDRAKSHYRLIAFRDSATLNRAMPADGWPNATPLKVESEGEVVGWAALRDRRFAGDPKFGGLRVGSVVDALAVPGHEATVAMAARRRLAERGVDMIGAVFSHSRWIEAFRASGFVAIPNMRDVGFTQELADLGGGVGPLLEGTHFSLMDADGPRLF